MVKIEMDESGIKYAGLCSPAHFNLIISFVFY